MITTIRSEYIVASVDGIYGFNGHYIAVQSQDGFGVIAHHGVISPTHGE